MNTMSESEELIMNLLWQKESCSIMQIVNEFNDSKNWTKHAIISFLNKLEKKGFVAYRINGRTRYYYAKINQDALIKSETESIVKRFFKGKPGAMISYMIKEDCSPEEIDELMDYLNELKEKNQND